MGGDFPKVGQNVGAEARRVGLGVAGDIADGDKGVLGDPPAHRLPTGREFKYVVVTSFRPRPLERSAAVARYLVLRYAAQGQEVRGALYVEVRQRLIGERELYRGTLSRVSVALCR